MTSLGAWVIFRGDTARVDQPHRRTLSIFRGPFGRGWRWFKQQLKLGCTMLFWLFIPQSIGLPDIDYKKTCVA